MRENWQAKRRFHIFKSVTGKYVLIDHQISDDWQLYTESLSEFILKLTTFGVFRDETWFDDDDFNDDEKKLINDTIELNERANEQKEEKEQALLDRS